MMRVSWLAVLLLLCSVCPGGAANLVGQWRFDEGAGTTCADSSGQGATAAIRGATWSETARFGKALAFDGVDDCVEIPDGAWNRSAPLTLTCWFRSQGGGTLFDHRRAADQPGCFAAFAGDGAFTGYDGTRTHIAGAKAGVVEDTWTFLAHVVTSTEVRSYCNGILTGVIPLKGFPKLDGRLFLGARGEPQPKFFFKGLLDEVSVYDDALTAEEVRARYLNGLAGYWKLNEGLGTVVYDYSGNGAHGELVGGAQWEGTPQGPQVRLDGKTGYVAIPNGVWNSAAPITFLCWYNAENGAVVFDHGLGGAIPGAYAFYAGGRFACYDAKVKDIGGAGVPAVQKTWTCVAVAISPTEIRCYADGVLKSVSPISDFPRTVANLYLGARGEVPDGYLAGSVREMAIYHRTLGPEEIAALQANAQRGVPIFQPATGLKLLAVQPDKVLYHPADTGTVAVTVKNFATTPQTASLRLTLITRLATAQPVAQQEITLNPLETRLLLLKVPFAGQEYGTVVQAALVQGETVFDRAEDVVSVAENPWFVGVGGKVAPGELGLSSQKRMDDLLQNARNRYANWLELFFWAPDDWGNLTPTVESWYSGQANYPFSRTRLKEFIDHAHAQGIKMVTYGKSTAGSPDGWEIARQRPEWFYLNNGGAASGIFNVRMLDRWNDPEARKGKENFDWLWLYPDCRRVDALEFGLRQIADSATQYGWDGVRFDGHFTTSSDAVSTWNMRHMKEFVWARHPRFLFGYNYAFAPENYPTLTHEMREGMAGGGMWMQEAIKDFAYGDSLRYTRWTQSKVAAPAYAPHELAVAKQIQGMGGSYHCIYTLDTSPKSLYKLVYGLIAGAHSVYGSHETAPGCDNWGKFMTRWGTFLWHPRLQPVANPAVRIQVEAPGLYWQPLVQEFVDTPTRKYTVLHLVNPSPEDEIAKTTLPAPVERVRVRVNGMQVARVVAVSPEREPYDQPLPVTMQDGKVEITVPRVAVWTMVILEETGAFPVPPAEPRFTEQPDPKAVAAGRSATTGLLTNDPLQPAPVGLVLKENEQLYETDTGYNSVPAQAGTDALACNGRAQVRESGVRGMYFGRTWLGSFLPGRYQIRMRVRMEDTQQPPRPQSANITVYILIGGKDKTFGVNFHSDPEKAPAERRFVIDGQYHDYVVAEVEFRQTGMLHVIGGAAGPEGEGSRFCCDHIIVSQLERYPDEKLAAWIPVTKPDGLRTPQGRTPQKVLQVCGLYWQQYGVERLVPATNAYALPAKYEELYAYDVVVLANVSLLGTDYATRRMLQDYVADGGRLVFLGGPHSLGQGGLPGTCLEAIVPFTLKADGKNEVVQCAKPLLLGARPGKPFADKPALYWRHTVGLRPGAFAVAYAGEAPVAARIAHGQGLVTAFAGTVLGTPATGETPCWLTPSWRTVLGGLVLK